MGARSIAPDRPAAQIESRPDDPPGTPAAAANARPRGVNMSPAAPDGVLPRAPARQIVSEYGLKCPDVRRLYFGVWRPHPGRPISFRQHTCVFPPFPTVSRRDAPRGRSPGRRVPAPRLPLAGRAAVDLRTRRAPSPGHQLSLFYLTCWVTLVIFIIVGSVLAYAMIKFRAKDARPTSTPSRPSRATATPWSR